MREKNKLEVTFDLEQSFEFMRFVHENSSLEFRKSLEAIFGHIKDNANLTFANGLRMALESDRIDSHDFLAGVLFGLGLAVATGRPNEAGSIMGFLAENKRAGVTNIAEAFRKRGKA